MNDVFDNLMRATCWTAVGPPVYVFMLWPGLQSQDELRVWLGCHR